MESLQVACHGAVSKLVKFAFLDITRAMIWTACGVRLFAAFHSQQALSVKGVQTRVCRVPAVPTAVRKCPRDVSLRLLA